MPPIATVRFVIDLPTLCALAVLIAATSGALLMFSWVQNRRVPALGLWGLGYLLASGAAALVATRGFVPDLWAVCGANALICCAYGLLWGGIRSFEGRPTRAIEIVAGAAIWIAAYHVASFSQSIGPRVTLISLILATYTLLGARELWHARDQELISRWPMLALLVLHASFLLGRIPLAGALAFSGAGQPHGAAISIMAFESVFATFCLALLCVAMSKERAELEQRKAAFTDSLTGIPNRRAFFELGGPLLDGVVRERHSAALLLFDLDRFKEVNDTAGHQAGDRVLEAFAGLLAASVRAEDLCGRLGGEEFAALLPNASMAEALQRAERLRQDFEAMRIPGLAANATVSIGIAMTSEATPGLVALLASADRALYRAKAEGRNRVARAPLMVLGTTGSDPAVGRPDKAPAVAMTTPSALPAAG